MGENEIIVLAGRDLFHAGVSIGLGVSVGAFAAIGLYTIVSAAFAWLRKMWTQS